MVTKPLRKLSSEDETVYDIDYLMKALSILKKNGFKGVTLSCNTILLENASFHATENLHPKLKVRVADIGGK